MKEKKSLNTGAVPEPQRSSNLTFENEYPAPPWVYKNCVENMSRKESLDIIYQIAAEAKQQIARGECCTIAESRAHINAIRSKMLKKNKK